MVKMIATPIMLGLISILFSTFFTRIWEIYIPDKNTLSSYIKNFLYFSLRYFLPITYIIFLFIFVAFSKLFVLNISICITFIFFSLTIDIFSKVREIIRSQNSVQEQLLETYQKNISILKSISSNMADMKDDDSRIVKILNKLTIYIHKQFNK